LEKGIFNHKYFFKIKFGKELMSEFNLNDPPTYKSHKELYEKEETRVTQELSDNYEEGKPWKPKTIKFEGDAISSGVARELIAGYQVMGWVIENVGEGSFSFKSNHNLERMTKTSKLE
jgi:hypothetical protein